MEYLEQIKELTDDGNFDTCSGPYTVSRESMKEVWRIVAEMQTEIKTLKPAPKSPTTMKREYLEGREKEYIFHFPGSPADVWIIFNKENFNICKRFQYEEHSETIEDHIIPEEDFWNEFKKYSRKECFYL